VVNSLTLDQVVIDFAYTVGKLPSESIQWSLDNWAEAGPAFVEILDRYVTGEDRTETPTLALAIIVHLLAEKRERKAFPILCQLMHQSNDCERLLDDIITMSLGNILISTFDGNHGLLQSVIEDQEVDEFIRDAAFGALAYLVATYQTRDLDFHAYLARMYTELLPQDQCYVWSGWADAVTNLGYEDLAEQMYDLCRRGVIDSQWTDADWQQERLALVLADATRLVGFEEDRMGPLDSAVELLSSWYCFSPQYLEDQRRDAKRLKEEKQSDADLAYALSPQAMAESPFRGTGRNDPCPCGSGKKFKKCCYSATPTQPKWTATEAAQETTKIVL
jgi:hypothetical protein